MEARGGNGYIEDWPNARLVRDAHLGVIWDGTSSVNALDVIQRAVGKERAHLALGEDLGEWLADATGPAGAVPYPAGRRRCRRRVRFAGEVADDPRHERFTRGAASARLSRHDGGADGATRAPALGADGGDARRLLMARLVLEHRLSDRPKLSLDGAEWEEEAITALLDDAPVPLDRACEMLVA